MLPLHKYIFKCETESTQVTSWSTVTPTECPNNSSHTINPNSMTIIETISNDKTIILNPKLNIINNPSFIRLGTYTVPVMKYARVYSISNIDNSGTSYIINIYDKNNNIMLLSTTLTNTTESIQNLGILTNLPNETTQIELSVKRVGGNNNTKVYVESLTIYYN